MASCSYSFRLCCVLFIVSLTQSEQEGQRNWILSETNRLQVTLIFLSRENQVAATLLLCYCCCFPQIISGSVTFPQRHISLVAEIQAPGWVIWVLSLPSTEIERSSSAGHVTLCFGLGFVPFCLNLFNNNKLEEVREEADQGCNSYKCSYPCSLPPT